ncbi:1-phosphatidylinositol-3-phosphate 5-kinase [Pseudohyphozyma bogoriensis]|nr:1-phosphatidylinositol-3-phosphate 5-kinase [Pseudohyphozyma bogoriensis]
MAPEPDGADSGTTFESFPAAFPDEPEEAKALSALKRLGALLGATSSSTPPPPPPATPAQPPPPPSAAQEPIPLPAPPPSAATSASSDHASQLAPPTSTKHSHSHSRSSSAATKADVPARPLPVPFPSSATPSSRPQTPDFPVLPNGRRMVRPLRLSGVAPSVRLTVANSDKGDLVQSGSSRSVVSDYRFGNSGDSIYGSPSAHDGFGSSLAHLGGIPGFTNIGSDFGGDDSRSVRSMSTVANHRPSASVAHIFRRLRGEGLSKEYWIKDDSSKECFDCNTVFTAFRRKHHCRICGQIFCSRCASNIISSARFGNQGFVRVCNLCLNIMEEGIDPAPPSEPASRFRSGLRESTTLTISAPLEASARPPQSEFAASHLFPRSETPYGFAAGSKSYRGREEEADGTVSGYGARNGDEAGSVSSRAATPGDYFDEDGASTRGGGSPNKPKAGVLWLGEPPPPAPTTAVAPFRRELVGDDRGPDAVDGLGISNTAIALEDDVESGRENDSAEASPERVEGIGSPILSQLSMGIIKEASPDEEAEASATPVTATGPPKPFPTSSSPPKELSAPSHPSMEPSHSPQIPPPSSSGSSPQVLSSDFVVPSPDPDRPNLDFVHAASSAASVDYLDRPETPAALPSITTQYLRKMLLQSLERAGIPNPRAWENELMKLLVKIAKYSAPNVQSGDSMDVREYVRIKKIPGGHPRDSEYLDGVVFTKNVTHKGMARHLSNPRIMLFSFPLEYQRVENQLMSIDPVIQQEKEYLRNLVTRIVAQRPHVILAERNVSRIALEYLMEANVAVARNVSPEAIAAVARSTQADIISSMDKLALEPRLGRCASFKIQTFVHSLIPGKRKTLMRFDGCARDLGCTILLRGGTMEVLTKVKRIVNTMAFVAYNAKLEAHLFRDELIVPLPLDTAQPLRPVELIEGRELRLDSVAAQDRERISNDIARALYPFQTTALSASPLVKFPPPYALARLSEEDRRVTALRRLREYEETEQIIQEEETAARQESALPTSSSSASLISMGSGKSRAVSFSEKHVPSIDDAMKVLQTPQDVARMSEFSEAEERHAEQLAVWNTYKSQTSVSLDPEEHQKLFVLESLACSQTDRLCTPPEVQTITFYGENDVTLGQYIERVCREAGKTCAAPACQRPMIMHWRRWVHGQYRVSIIPEVHVVDLRHPELEGQIVMWSWCKLCMVGSEQAAMSEDTYRLSFGKYLELCFYPQDLFRADRRCEHNAHLDHVRYWSFRGITFQITVETIDLRNVIPPPLGLKIKPEKQLQLRNEEYITVLNKSTAFWDSILHRIVSFNYDLVSADRLEESHTAMDELKIKCEVDRRAIVKLLEKTYEEAQATNGTEMTSVRRALQNKAVEWEGEFSAFEQRIIPTEKDVRRLTTVQLKRLFSDATLPTSPERRTTSAPGLAPSIELDEEKQDACELESNSSAADSSISSSDGFRSRLTKPPSSSSSGVPSSTSSPSSSLLLSPNLDLSALNSTDNDSDSTLCAPSKPRNTTRIASPFIRRRSLIIEDTSGAESDQDVTPSRRRPPAPGVANLVSFFSDGGKDSASDNPSAPSPSRPLLRRGVTDKPRSNRPRQTLDVFSDGGGSYARNVGVAHLSSKSFAEKPSRIPARKDVKGNSLAKLFDQPPGDELRPSMARASSHYGRLVTSPTHSRSSSRPASRAESRAGRSRENSDKSTVHPPRPTLSAASSSRSLKGKGKDHPNGSRDVDTASVSSKASKSSRDLGLARPTTSSANKAHGVRRRVPSSGTSGHRVSTIANHFNKMSREAEREHQRKLSLFRNKRARPVAIAHSTIQVFDNVRDAVKEDSDDDESSHSSGSDGADDEHDEEEEQPEPDEDRKVDAAPVRRGPSETSAVSSKESFVYEGNDAHTSIAEALLHHPVASVPKEIVGASEDDASRTDGQELEPPSVPTSPRLDGAAFPRMSEGESSGNERGSIIKAISNLWSYRGGDFTPLDYPLHPSEHIFADNPILVREDEPSSIIAFALSSKAYRDKLKEDDMAHVMERSEAFMPDETHPADRSTSWGLLDLHEGTDAEETLRKPEAKHFRLQFEEGTTKFFCKIFFAEQFDALRRNCGCSSQFIESLARCVKWDSSGGKSKVDFMKTRDDRFIIKEVSRLEMDALLRFAPAYFSYMSKSLFHGLPTILAKIYGQYRISLRNPTTGKVVRLDVLVMENLFYERQLTQVFDLKGSTRNRHVQVSPDRPNEVLMDENLVEISYKSPLYVREASKRFIKAAVYNDSLFLSNLNVMDYSLVVGVDSVKQELVVGIVDFIRTYTWDKKLESWVKDTAFLGGGSSKPGGPTIVTPKSYKNRFRAAMNDYFLLAPDPWLHQTSLLPLYSKFTPDAKELFATKEAFHPLPEKAPVAAPAAAT